MDLPLRPNQHRRHDAEPYESKTWEVGIDLGSTFSAAAFCLTSASTDRLQAGVIQKVNGYKQASGTGLGNTSRCEVPTQVRYEEGGKFVRIGYEVVSMTERGADKTIPGHRVELFKPGLEADERTRDARRRLEETLSALPFPKSVDDVAADFLTGLLKHVKTRMVAKGYDDRDQVHLICTVPAMWKKRAKRRTLNAFSAASKKSGFIFSKNVSLCSEPQAAAAYVVNKFGNIQWKHGDVFIVCDAGGITTDAVTYVVLESNPLRLKEVVKGDGILCGSSDLNRKFLEQVEERLMDQTYLNAIANGKPLDSLIQTVLAQFEDTIKRQYEGGEDVPWWVQVPGLDPAKAPTGETGFTSSEMAVTADHLESVFKPILNECRGLMQSQLEAAYEKKREPTVSELWFIPTTSTKKLTLYSQRILFVGGLSNSPRFRSDMEDMSEALTKHKRKPILCLFPDSGEFAIAAGSILCSLNKCVVEDHVSRSSVAIVQHNIYQPRLPAHRTGSPEFDELEGRYYMHDCVEILLKDGDLIPSTGLRKTSHLHRTILAEEDKLHLTVTIFDSDDQNIAQGYPISHPGNKGFEALENVSFDIDIAPLRVLLPPRNTRNNQQYHEPLRQLRRSNRKLRGNPRRGIEPPTISNSSQTADSDPNGLHCLSHQHASPVSEDACSLEETPDYDYFWVDYQLDVEFKDTLMNYKLICPVADLSYEGVVNLAPSLETWFP